MVSLEDHLPGIVHRGFVRGHIPVHSFSGLVKSVAIPLDGQSKRQRDSLSSGITSQESVSKHTPYGAERGRPD